MKLDKAIKGLFVRCILPALRNRRILNLVPRELVQFAFFQKGYFEFQPDNQLLASTAISNNPVRYAMLDLDKYKPTVAALEFFYPRLSPGGYLFAHDYNSSESDWAVSRAVDAFLRDKPEKLVEIPDIGGSILFRKC